MRWKPHKAMIYMEYCEGGSLQDLINERVSSKMPISEEYVWNILFQLTSALLYCHLGLQVDNKGRVSSDRREIALWNPVLHRDIKPGNVFLFSRSETALDCVRLGDFGLGYVLQNDVAPETYGGTAQYLAPEINRTSTRSIHWTEHCDIFSLGCTIYALCMFRPPFNYHMETDSEVYEPVPEQYSDQLRACISSCLSYYPQTRPNALRLFQQSQRRIEVKKIKELEIVVPVVRVLDLAKAPSTSDRSSATSKKRKSRKKRPARLHVMNTEECRHGTLSGAAADLTSFTSETQNLPNNVLREAVIKGDVDLIQKALEMEGANPNATTTDSSRIPMLSLATEGRHEQVIKVLIDAGADINQGSCDKSRALHRAAKHNRRAIVEELLERGVSVDEIDELGRTALSYAAEEGHSTIVGLLLDAHADPNGQGFDKRTPLHWAALKGHYIVGTRLLAAGSSISSEDSSGMTAEALAKRAGNHTAALAVSSSMIRGLVKNNPFNNENLEVLAAKKQRRQVSKANQLTLGDLKKFSQDFQILQPVPKDLIPILSNNKTKQEEIDRLSKRKHWKTGMPLAEHHTTKKWVPEPTASTFVQPKPQTETWQERMQTVLRDPAIVRVRLPSSGDVRVRLPPSSGDISRVVANVPHNERQLEGNNGVVQPEDMITAPLRSVPPIPTTWSQVVRRGTVNDVRGTGTYPSS